MELFSDKPALAAAALTRLLAAERDGAGRLPGRVHAYLSDLVVRNGPGILEQVAVELARQHLGTLQQLAALAGRPAARLLDEVELAAAMEGASPSAVLDAEEDLPPEGLDDDGGPRPL
jgi:hypothetical protein